MILYDMIGNDMMAMMMTVTGLHSPWQLSLLMFLVLSSLLTPGMTLLEPQLSYPYLLLLSVLLLSLFALLMMLSPPTISLRLVLVFLVQSVVSLFRRLS